MQLPLDVRPWLKIARLQRGLMGNQVGQILAACHHPATERLLVTERFRRKDFGHMEIFITIDDSKVATRPWTMAFALERAKDKKYEVMEEACWENEVDTPELLAVGMKMYPGPRYPK